MSEAMNMDDFEPEPPPRAPSRPESQRVKRASPETTAQPPSREPPASEEAEIHVLGCCLLDEGLSLDRARLAGLTPESFYLPARRLIFERLLQMRAEEKPIGLDTLVQELQVRKELESVGGMSVLINLSVGTTAHAGYMIDLVKEKAGRRDLIRSLTGLVEQSYNGVELPELLQKGKAQIEAIESEGAAHKAAEAAKALTARRVSQSHPPPEPVTRLFLAKKPIATPGNLVTLTSKAKVGKTAALSGVTAAIIAATTSTLDRDTLGFSAANPDGHAVIIFDTEQSPYDAFLCYQRALRRADTDADPKWLLHYSLVGYSVPQLLAALDLALAQAVKLHKGIFCIILDGVADFVTSVNDEVECNGFVTWLRVRAVAFDCPILCVIHSNEAEKSGDDGRGHIGKQLIRKAESNLLLKKDGEVTTITSDKQRKAPITEADGIAFQWSDERHMHVSCGQPTPRAKGGRRNLYTIEEFIQVIPLRGAKPMTAGQLHRFANDLKTIKLQTWKDLLARAVEDGTLSRTYDEKIGFTYCQSYGAPAPSAKPAAPTELPPWDGDSP